MKNYSNSDTAFFKSELALSMAIVSICPIEISVSKMKTPTVIRSIWSFSALRQKSFSSHKCLRSSQKSFDKNKGWTVCQPLGFLIFTLRQDIYFLDVFCAAPDTLSLLEEALHLFHIAQH